MSTETPSLAETLDLAALNDLRDMLGDDLTDIINSFILGVDAEVAHVEQATTQTSTDVRAAAHSIKGSAGNMGAKLLADVASQIEKAAHSGDMSQCHQLMPALTNAATHAKLALQTYLSGTA